MGHNNQVQAKTTHTGPDTTRVSQCIAATQRRVTHTAWTSAPAITTLLIETPRGIMMANVRDYAHCSTRVAALNKCRCTSRC